MHNLLLILDIITGLVGLSCLVTGWGSLVGADEKEIAEIELESKIARETKANWYQVQLPPDKWFRLFKTNEGIIEHWRTRPEARKFIFAGIAFLAIAAGIGFFTGLFD